MSRIRATDYASRSSVIRGDDLPALLILAGTLQECWEVVNSYDIKVWAYVRAELTLRKHGALSRVILYGSYQKRPDWPQLAKRIRVMKMVTDEYKEKKPPAVVVAKRSEKRLPRPKVRLQTPVHDLDWEYRE